MTDFGQALTNIKGTVNTILTPLITDDTIQTLQFTEKIKGTPELPLLKVLFYETTTDYTTIGSLGNNESWILDMRLVGIVKEPLEPVDGVLSAADIVSKARTLLLSNRQLNLPQLVRKVDSTSIEMLPYPIGKKRTLYGAGARFKVYFVIDNTRD